MAMRHPTYFLRKMAENLGSHRLQFLFLLLSISCPLILFGIFLLFYDNVDHLAHRLREAVQFTIYLQDNVVEGGGDSLRRIKKSLDTDGRIASSSYISKQEALQRFKKTERDEALLTGLGENPFPASFEVRVRAPYQAPLEFKKVASHYEKMSGVEEVRYTAEWLQGLDGFLRLSARMGGGIGCLLAVAVVMIVANAIRAHFHDRAEEVEIMRLIGATHAFIILPFLLEGCLAGLLGGGLSILFLFATVQVSNAVLASIPLAGYPIAFHFFSPHLLFGFILAGGGLGGLGSFLSLRQPSS